MKQQTIDHPITNGFLGVPQRKLRIMGNVNVNADEGRGWGVPGPKSNKNNEQCIVRFCMKWGQNGVRGLEIGRIGAKFRCAFFCFREYS